MTLEKFGIRANCHRAERNEGVHVAPNEVEAHKQEQREDVKNTNYGGLPLRFEDATQPTRPTKGQ